MKFPASMTYADRLRVLAKGKHGKGGSPMTIRMIADALGYSYEHVRKVFIGEPVVSDDFNDEICKLFGVDKDEMWKVAEKEKAQRTMKRIPKSLHPPSDDRLKKI